MVRFFVFFFSAHVKKLSLFDGSSIDVLMTYCHYVIVRPLSTVGYTSVVASVIHSRQWSN